MENVPNYYQLLHVLPDAPVPVIKASYRAMMQKMRLHPDLGGDEAIAKILNEAVSTLCDPDAREAYDLELSHREYSAAGGEPAWNADKRAANSESTSDSAPVEDEKPSSKKYSQAASNEPSGKARANYSHLPKREQCPFCHASYPTYRSSSIGYSNEQRCAQCKAAATPIEQFSSDCADDVRKIYRHEHQTHACLWTQWPVEKPLRATMTDMSLAGCAIDSASELAVHSIVVLDTELLNGICIVRYCKKIPGNTTYSIGMEFLTLDITSASGAVFSATA